MPAGTIGNRKSGTRRNRRISGQHLPAQRAVPLRIATALVTGSVLSVTYNQAVCLKGVPKYGVNLPDAAPVSAIAVSPTQIDITYDQPLTAVTSLSVPYEDPAVRNPIGGYVTPYVDFLLS